MGPPHSRRRYMVIAGAVAFWLLWMVAGAVIGVVLRFSGKAVGDALIGAFAAAVLWTVVFSVLRLVLGWRMSTYGRRG